ncbi:class II glutamine amidotransferase [uncultured Sneathiella sp.]|jgi:glutamine amidotransferase|uniref:class II glutamine amidotransferase n=1 Tax=uncultured Sneathiella sp. TaxID=879315 RepID=UPI0030D9BD91|tara:strand:- start:12192 stop:13010 length:819 start_codon:yes stop_codon:yes gene_type:complete
MCELFAVSSRDPISLTYSLREFARHGGLSHSNKSGWGISFQQNADTLLIKEPKPAFDSPWIKFVEENKISSHSILAHVRYATEGKDIYENTHPFKREAYGRAHVFAHNGSLQHFKTALPLISPRFTPMGATDSEHAFCYLLDQLAPLWYDGIPALSRRLEVIAYVAEEIRSLGAFNFLYSDGDALFVHADLRRYDDHGVFGPRTEPALHWIERRHLRTAGLELSSPTDADSAALIFASVPLGDDTWQDLPRGSVLAVQGGEIVDRIMLAKVD